MSDQKNNLQRLVRTFGVKNGQLSYDLKLYLESDDPNGTLLEVPIMPDESEENSPQPGTDWNKRERAFVIANLDQIIPFMATAAYYKKLKTTIDDAISSDGADSRLKISNECRVKLSENNEVNLFFKLANPITTVPESVPDSVDSNSSDTIPE